MAGARFACIILHTDAEREYAYDRQSKIGKFDKALDEAKQRGWTVVDMKRGWNKVCAIKSTPVGFIILMNSWGTQMSMLFRWRKNSIGVDEL